MPDINVQAYLTREQPVVWLFCGDSITQGARHTRGHRDFSQLFKERLGEMARNEDVVVNTAVGGWSSGSMEGRWEDRVARFKPDVVFFMFGTNDAASDRFDPEELLLRMSEWPGRIPDSKAIWMSPVPVAPTKPEAVLLPGKRQGFERRQERLPVLVERMRSHAKERNIDFIDHWAVFGEAGFGMVNLMDGGFHPNEYGHRQIAHTMFRRLGMWDDQSWVCRLFIPL